MASLPTVRRIAFEDIPGAPTWLKAMLLPLNQFMEGVYSGFNRQLSLGDNVRATVKSIPFSTPADYWNPCGIGDYDQVLRGTISGYSALAGGAVTTINTPAVSATSEIMLCRRTLGGFPGTLTYGNVVAGTSFDILSSNPADNGEATWMIINPTAPGFAPIRFQNNFPTGVRTQGVFPLSITQSNGTPVLLPVTIPTWTEPVNGMVQIDLITGLQASTNYTGTFLVV